jgi:hypothetical protein
LCVLSIKLCFQHKYFSNGGFDVFFVHGFDKWKKLTDGKSCAFLGHVACSQHNNSVTKFQAMKHKLHGKGRNNFFINAKTLVAAVRWLTFQFCAFRRHDEKTTPKK